MTTKTLKALAVLVAALAIAPFALRAQQPDVDREMEEAKALYRGADFAEAIVKLQDVVGRLQALRNLDVKRIQLADAHLHLALSYHAIENLAAAKDNLKAMLRLDPQRRLDPQVYAPPVLALLEEARAEVATERPAGVAAARAAASPSPATKKGGSKTVPILVGAGAAAAGIAVAAGSGGGGTTATIPTGVSATPTPTPTPTPNPLTSQKIVFIGSDPPPGSTISVASAPYEYGPQDGRRVVLRVTVSATAPRDGTFWFHVNDGRNPECIGSGSAYQQVVANQSMTAVADVSYPTPSTTCALPFTTSLLHADLCDAFAPSGSGCSTLQANFPLSYTFVP